MKNFAIWIMVFVIGLSFIIAIAFRTMNYNAIQGKQDKNSYYQIMKSSKGEDVYVGKGYIYDETFLPIPYSISKIYDELDTKDIELLAVPFEGIDAELAAKIGYAVVDSKYGIEKLKMGYGENNGVCLFVEKVKNESMYSVVLGPSRGTGAGIEVLIQESDGAIYKIIEYPD